MGQKRGATGMSGGTGALRAWRYRIFAIAWITYAGYYLGRVNLAVAIPALGGEFGWSKAALGLLGSAFYWVYAAGQLVNGHLGDRLSARRFVALGLAASGVLNLLFGWSSAFALLLALWALNGWAQSTGWGPIMKTLSRWFTPAQRGRLTAFFSPCYVAGHALSWALAGALIARSGWRTVFWVPGVLLLVLALAWYVLARDAPADRESTPGLPPSRPASSQTRTRGSLLARTRVLLTDPRLVWAVSICFFSGMIKDGLTLWGPTYLMERQGLGLSSAALTGTLIPVAGVAGAFVAGGLLHRYGARGETPVVAAMAGLIAAAVLGLYALGESRLGLAMGMLAVMAFGGHGMNALLLASLPLSLGPEGEVSSAAGTLDFVSYVGGGLGAALVGWLQDAVGWVAVYAWWAAVALAITAIAVGHARRTGIAVTARLAEDGAN